MKKNQKTKTDKILDFITEVIIWGFSLGVLVLIGLIIFLIAK